MKKLILLILPFLLLSCRLNNKNDLQSKIIFDMLNRKVSISKTIERVVAVGPGALRLYCYVGLVEKVVGIEQFEKDNPTGRPYILANKSLISLEIIGAGGPNNNVNTEKILAVAPDVIFTTYAVDKATADELQMKTGVPVIVLNYGNTPIFDNSIYESLLIIGKTINNEKRANEVVEFMKSCEIELNNRTKAIVNINKPKTYIGALSMKGAHGIESTFANYPLFNVVNANNVVDEIGKTGSFMIDREKLLFWNPDIIFLDYNGLIIVNDDYKKNPIFYKTLKAFENGEVYSLLPYNFYATNIDTAIANAYYIGKVLYPNEFIDVNPAIKADEIYQFLLGKELYLEMTKDFGEFNKLVFKKL